MFNNLKSKKCLDCAVCCLESEMELSLEDINVIERNNVNNWKREDFCNFHQDYYRLRNLNGHCFFLNIETKKCKIYDFRPMGCRFYPLIFDLIKNRCKFDNDCPYKKDFPLNIEKNKILCKELKKWVKRNLI